MEPELSEFQHWLQSELIDQLVGRETYTKYPIGVAFLKGFDRIKIFLGLMKVKEVPYNRIDDFIDGTKAKIKYGSNSAHYSILEDMIYVPYQCQMCGNYGILNHILIIFHELIHWTMKRCNRPISSSLDPFGYACEEVIAEIGSALLLNHFHLINDYIINEIGHRTFDWMTQIEQCFRDNKELKYMFGEQTPIEDKCKCLRVQLINDAIAAFAYLIK